MLTPAQIIRQHKEHLLRRLVSRSPLLNFRPRGQGLMDVCDLFKGIPPNPLIVPENAAEAGGCQSSNDFLRALLGDAPMPARIVKPAKPVFAKCRRIAELNRDYHHATGGWALYLGYPLVFVRNNTRKNPFWAPLFFWKIEIKADRKNAVTFSRRGEDGEAESPDFNRVLASWLLKEGNGIYEPDTESIRLGELPKIVRDTLAPWRNCEMQFFNDIKPDLFVEEPGSNSPDAAVYPYATLGYGEFKYQSLLNDLDSLGDKIDSANCGCLDFFLCPRSRKMDNEIAPPSERDRISVTEADASQEKVIWQARESQLTVLQGPPGTGKSQTIVNLIADALRCRKRVAVICHHDAALNVVRKRMDANGLKNLSVKITQPRHNRKALIESIRSIESDDISDAHENRRLRKSKAIERHEKTLDDFHQGFQNKDGKPRFGDILARLDAMREAHNIDIRQPRFRPLCRAIRDCFRGELQEAEKAQEEIGQFVADFEKCDYTNNPWQELTQEKPDAENLKAMLSGLIGDGAVLESTASTSRASLHGDADKWFAEHPLAVMHYPGMTETPDIQRGYGDFLCKVRNELGEYLPYSAISGFLAEYRCSGNFNALKKCQSQIKNLEHLLAARRQLRDNEIICALKVHLEMPADDWRYYFFAAVLLNWLENDYPPIGVGDIHEIENAHETLQASLQDKQALDRSTVTAQFDGKSNAREELQDQNLLRIRGGGWHRKTTVRDLYYDGFNFLTEIYPVLLANPDSACQILPLTPGLFDLLIIDEASQVFTSDALSMLYRAKRVVISGDKMQMPPSDFFTLAVDDIGDGGDDGAEQEPPSADANRSIPADGEYSLLDAAEYAVFSHAPNRKTLEVHYRSQVNELIDFSNRAFYSGKLQIPSGNFSLPSFLARPITLKEVGGEFSNRVNRKEIKEIITTLKDIWGNSCDYSVGVIVFNTAQRDALIDALNNAPDANFRKRLEESRNMQKEGEFQGFFVRSVEHVQGDERDIIILGTTYGKDSRKFGPIIRKEKGRRRLNVAVTRAKVGMFVVTSLDINNISYKEERPADGDAKKESERWFLWMYMRYASAVSNGNAAEINAVLDEIAPPPPRPPLGEPESEFERQVGDFLIANNYAVEYQVGESGFRIDIGVKEKTESKIYLCGIECDGAPFHSGWRARHRDIWRQSILENKGWEIYRIWSTRWFHNKEAAQNGLLEYLKTLRERNSD